VQRLLSAAVVVTIAELVVIIEVAQRLGVTNTLGVLLAVSILGGLVVKAQGVAALRRLVADVDARRVPGSALADGALAVLAGVFLLIPGFLTDIPGLLLLLPPVRSGVRSWLRNRWTRRFIVIPNAPRRDGPRRDYPELGS
jgi:UPF0716 protein FxsA